MQSLSAPGGLMTQVLHVLEKEEIVDLNKLHGNLSSVAGLLKSAHKDLWQA